MTGAKNLPVFTTREQAISLFTGDLRLAVESIPLDIANMSESEIFAVRKPTRIDWFLRKNLWNSIETARKAGEVEISQASIYAGVCSEQNFRKVMGQPLRLAWMLFHPRTDMDKWEEALSYGLDRFREEFMTMPITKDTAGHFLRALEMLITRVHGPVIQRIEAKHAHLNMNKPIEIQEPQSHELLESIRDKIAAAKDVTEKI